MARKLLVILTLAIPLYAQTVYALEEDKKMHAIGSAAFGGLSLAVVDVAKPEWPSWKKWIVAGSIAMIPGIAKEVTDDSFDWGDIAADAIGAYGGSAAVITLTIRW